MDSLKVQFKRLKGCPRFFVRKNLQGFKTRIFASKLWRRKWREIFCLVDIYLKDNLMTEHVFASKLKQNDAKCIVFCVVFIHQFWCTSIKVDSISIYI